MFDIKFYEVFEEEKRTLNELLPRAIKAEYSRQTIQESGDLEPNARLISIRTHSNIPLRWADSISGVLSRSQGFDHLKTYLERTSTQISLGHLGKYCSRSVAEHAVMASLNLIKRTKAQLDQFRSFRRDRLTGLQARGRKVLVVGVGSIGQEIVALAKGLGMAVKGVDIAPQRGDIDYVTLEDGIKWAEIVYCALPLTGQTERMLNYGILANAGPGKFMINISRGEITPLADMCRLLDEGVLAGLALDVFENEPLLSDTLRSDGPPEGAYAKMVLKMSERDNVFFTPHNAFNTIDSLKEKSRQTVAAVTEFLDKGRFPCQIQT